MKDKTAVESSLDCWDRLAKGLKEEAMSLYPNPVESKDESKKYLDMLSFVRGTRAKALSKFLFE